MFLHQVYTIRIFNLFYPFLKNLDVFGGFLSITIWEFKKNLNLKVAIVWGNLCSIRLDVSEIESIILSLSYIIFTSSPSLILKLSISATAFTGSKKESFFPWHLKFSWEVSPAEIPSFSFCTTFSRAKKTVQYWILSEKILF